MLPDRNIFESRKTCSLCKNYMNAKELCDYCDLGKAPLRDLPAQNANAKSYLCPICARRYPPTYIYSRCAACNHPTATSFSEPTISQENLEKELTRIRWNLYILYRWLKDL